MRVILVALAGASTWMAAGVQAADKVEIGAAPAWVSPITPPALSTKVDSAAVQVLLSDQQVALESGRDTVYSEFAVKIQTPQGLAAGNLSLAWRPDTDTLTVHKLRIRRGDKVIDVLASGQTFTVVRREANLESATLDGVLTANIQPEGLQVGDVLELAASVASSDPMLKGHVEAVGGAWNAGPIARAHFKAHWPSSLPVRFQGTTALPTLKTLKARGVTSVEVTLDDVQPAAFPKGAPLRYQTGRMIELTDFGSWADLASLMAPLYAKAAVLPAQGPLRAELERIRGSSSDPKVRTEAALALVQDRVRYVALAMGAGGYTPAHAEATWSRRYGDCKGKTALLLALLRSLDISADAVLVNATSGDGLDARLPMVGSFNHVLVRALVAGRTHWLHGTRTADTSLDRLVTPGFGWGLPLVAKGAALVRMVPAPLGAPSEEVSIRIDARAGLTVPAPVKVVTVMRGDQAIGANLAFANFAGAPRERALRDYWRGQYDFIEAKATAADFNATTGEFRLTLDGLAKMDWSSGWYETDGTSVGYEADFSRDPGPDSDAPFAVPFPYFNKVTETILLPPGFDGIKSDPKKEVDRTVAGIEYRRQTKVSDNVFTIEKTERSISPEFPAKDALAAQIALRAMAEQTVYLRRPADYQVTPGELKVALAETPTTAKAFFDRGRLLFDQRRFEEAITDFDRAATLGHALINL